MRTVRGLWVWSDGPSKTIEQAASFATFCLRHRIDNVFLSIKSPSFEYTPLISALRGSGVKVHALAGSSRWHLLEKREELKDWCSSVVKWNADNPLFQLDGVHLDIEPWLLPENQGPDNLIFVDALIDAAIAASDAVGQLAFSIDLPKKVFKMSEAQGARLIGSCPQLTLMAYSMGSDINAYAKKILTYLDVVDSWADGMDASFNPKLIIGISAADWGTMEKLNELLARLESGDVAAHPSYGGWAIHEYVGLKKLALAK